MGFGTPKMAPIFGGDIFDPTGPLSPYTTPPIAPMAQAVAKKPRQGINWLGVLADALSGAAGQPGMYAQGRRQEQQTLAQQALAEANRQRQNEDARSNFTFEQEYRAAHPAPQQPDEFDRTLTAGGILPGTPAWVAAHRTRADNMTNPMTAVDVAQPDGSSLRQWMRPPASGATPAPPAVGEVRGGHRFRGGDPADPASWEPVAGGGAGQPQARGTFPRQDGGAFDFRLHPTSR